jgi:hypothetical protein
MEGGLRGGDEERETNNGLLMIAEIHFKKKKKI